MRNLTVFWIVAKVQYDFKVQPLRVVKGGTCSEGKTDNSPA